VGWRKVMAEGGGRAENRGVEGGRSLVICLYSGPL